MRRDWVKTIFWIVVIGIIVGVLFWGALGIVSNVVDQSNNVSY